MTADWGAASIGALGWDDPAGADDWRYVPRPMRPLRRRAAITALVLLFAAGVVATLALPSYAFDASGPGGVRDAPPRLVQQYQAP